MRYLYYCNSAYQILTIMNLHWHRKYAGFEDIKDYDADIIILNSFSQAENLAGIIKKSSLFSNVWLVNKAYNSGRFHSFQTVIDFVFPAVYLKRNFGIEKSKVYKQYETICVPKYSTITAAIWRLNKNANLHLYEDGAGAYWGSINLKPDSRLYKKFYKAFNYGRDFYDYRKLYLNDAGLYGGDSKQELISIPRFNDVFLKKVKELFEEYTDIEDLQKKDIYYFAQFLNNKETISLMDDLLSGLEAHRDRTVYIPHPRHRDEKTYPFSYAKEKQIWEIRLSNIDDIENKLLISVHSTACITPKILFDKEPYVLLFYEMCDDKVTYRDERMDRFMERFIASYRDKSKIMLPKSKEEFFECVEFFLVKESQKCS